MPQSNASKNSTQSIWGERRRQDWRENATDHVLLVSLVSTVQVIHRHVIVLVEPLHHERLKPPVATHTVQPTFQHCRFSIISRNSYNTKRYNMTRYTCSKADGNQLNLPLGTKNTNRKIKKVNFQINPHVANVYVTNTTTNQLPNRVAGHTSE